MKKIKYLLLFICTLAYLLVGSLAFSQQTRVDSLENFLLNAKHDTTRLRLYFALGDACDVKDNLKYGGAAVKLIDHLLSQTTNDKERKKLLKQKCNALNYYVVFYQVKSDTANVFEYKRKRLSIYREIKDTANIVNSFHDLSDYCRAIGNFPKVLEYFQQGLSIAKQMNYKKGIATMLSYMGGVYNEQGDTAQALENFQKSLSMDYEMKDISEAADNLMKIGNLYGQVHNVSKAIDFFHKGILLYEKMNNKERVLWAYGEIGSMYKENRDYPNSLLNYQKSLVIAEEMNNPYNIKECMDCIGMVYRGQGDIVRSLEYHHKALKLAEDLHWEGGVAWSYLRLVRAYRYQKNYKLAKDYVERSLKMKMYFDVTILCELEQHASKIDSALGNCNSAFAHYQQYIILRDRSNSEEVHKAAAKERFQSEYDKQKAVDKAEQEKQTAVAAAESRKEKMIRYSVISGLILMLIVTLIIFRSLRITRKQKQIIEVQKTEVENSKHIIEEKNKDITDSINYAKRIQSSFLAPINEIAAALPNSFVLFKPKDIVSGDFYWFEKKEDKIFIAACDCTGHGVPGAIMSMLGADKLNEALTQSTDVSLMLSHINKGVKKALRQSGNDDSTRDGMDIALCAFEFPSPVEEGQGVRLEYAGANRPLYIIQNNKTVLEEIKATKSAIGGLTSDDQEFAKHTIQLNKGDTIYIASDGFADQFSPDDKKLMTKKFKEILVSIQDRPMEEQKNYLNTFLENWKGNMEQTDDVLVIGVRV